MNVPNAIDWCITWTNLTNNVDFWEIPLDDISVNGKSLGLTGRTVILDTGTSLTIIPQEDVRVIYNAIPGSSDQGNGIFYLPCKSHDVVSVTFSGRRWDISPGDLVDPSSSYTNGYCPGNLVGGYTGMDFIIFMVKIYFTTHCSQIYTFNIITGPPTQWVLGDTFLKNVYSIFDSRVAQIGLASLA